MFCLFRVPDQCAILQAVKVSAPRFDPEAVHSRRGWLSFVRSVANRSSDTRATRSARWRFAVNRADASGSRTRSPARDTRTGEAGVTKRTEPAGQRPARRLSNVTSTPVSSVAPTPTTSVGTRTSTTPFRCGLWIDFLPHQCWLKGMIPLLPALNAKHEAGDRCENCPVTRPLTSPLLRGSNSSPVGRRDRRRRAISGTGRGRPQATAGR